MVRKMKDSGVEWIGKIPEHWEIPKLKHVTKNYYSGGTPSAANEAFYSENGSYFANINDITNHNELTSTAKRITESGVKDKNLKIVPKESFLYAMYASVGKFSISKTDMYISQAILSFKEKNIKRGYLSLYFAFIGDYVDYFSFGTTQINLNAEIVKNLPILFPSSEEQETIANFLDNKTSQTDHIIEKSKESIEKYKRYKESLITETVTKGLDKNVSMKDSGIEWIGQIPEHWKVMRGKYILKKLDRAVFVSDEVVTCYRDGEVTLRKNRREDGFTFSIKEIGYQGIEPNDLVIHGMDGFAGAIGISDSRGKGSPILNILDSNQNKKFLMYYLRSMAYTEVFTAIATGIRIRSCDLRWNKISELPYPVPPLQEQEAIANFLDKKASQIDKIISEKERLIEKLETYKKSLIFEYVTGKKEVR